MNDNSKTKEQLSCELLAARQRIAELELAETERKRAEEALTQTAVHWQDTFDIIEDLVMIIDKDFRVVRANQAAYKAFAGARVLGAHCYELFHGTERPLPNCPFCETVKSGEVTHFEVCEQHLDGHWFDICAYPVKGKDGIVQQAVHIVRDITERKRAEEALRKSEEKLRAMFESTAEGITVTDLEGHITELNDAVVYLYGYSYREELIGRSAFDFIAEKDHAKAMGNMTKTLAEGRVSNVEYRCLAKDGREFAAELSAAPLRDESGNPAGFVAITRDITERKRAEEALGKLTHELDERVKELSCLYGISKFVENQDISLEEILQGIVDLIPPAWRYPEVTCARITMGDKEFKTDNFETTGWMQTANVRIGGHKEGTIEVYYLQERPDIDEGPFLTEERALIEAIAEEFGRIIERKHAEDALRESEEKFRKMFELSPEAIVLLDTKGNVLDVNDRVLGWLGYEPAEVIGKNLLELPFSPETSKTKAAESLSQRMLGEEIAPYELTFVSKSGEKRIGSILAAPMRDKEGTVLYDLVMISDITERKRAEQARVEQAAALARGEELQRSRQRLLIVQESLRRDIAQQLHGSVQNRLIVLLHRLTELERAASPGELAAELGDLRQELGDLLDTRVRPISRRLYPSILRRGLVPALQSLGDQYEVTVAIEMELDEDLVRQEKADPQFISEQVRLAAFRVAEEALTNVVKHAKASRVTIGLELSSEGWLRLTMRDNGQGFDVGSASDGLGILMMQDYAEVVGGGCIVRSAPDKGTEVTATLPLAGSGAELAERASSSE